jgi:hypothetical protein
VKPAGPVRFRERGARLEGQHVAGDVLGPATDRLGELLPPLLRPLAGEPVDEIDPQVVEAGRTRLREHPARIVGRVDAPEPAQVFVLKRLHPDVEAVDAGRPEAGQLLRADGPGVRLERDLDRLLKPDGAKSAARMRPTWAALKSEGVPPPM